MKRTILCMAMALMVSVAFGQIDAFKQLADIKGVEYKHYDKQAIQQVAATGKALTFGSPLDSYIQLGGGQGSAEFLGKMDDVMVFKTTSDKKAASQLKKMGFSFLKNEKYESMIDVRHEGVTIKIGCIEDGDKVKVVNYGKDKYGTSLFLVVSGSAELLKSMKKGSVSID
ncbi:MAG: DUF4252 domain-containing protein [Bacteroidaceae bacterium]|nr:DUF4252 domain-containing protein [Bacteroidaceae bacterium]